MYIYFSDPQDKKGHICPECGREHFNEGDLCSKCRERLEDEE